MEGISLPREEAEGHRQLLGFDLEPVQECRSGSDRERGVGSKARRDQRCWIFWGWGDLRVVLGIYPLPKGVAVETGKRDTW